MRLWGPPMWCPLRCCYISREMHESGRRGRCRAISTFVWSSVYWRVRTGITVGALERDTRPRDFTFSTISATRPSLRPAIVDAAASSGTGRVERVAARTLPCVVAARALPSATSIIACLRLSRNLCAVPRSGPLSAAGLVFISAGSTNQPLFYNLVKGAHGSNDASNELDDPLHRDAMLCV